MKQIDQKKSGYLLINKPTGITSHDVVNRLRKITGIRKIGHAGTLDPFAGGLLIVAVGREATKNISKFVKLDKTYKAEIKLGFVSDTFDLQGEIKKISNKKPDISDIEKVLKSFLGKQKQIPPMFSAKKVGGKKLYELARKGIEIERQPSDIEIYEIKLLEYKYPLLKIKVKCSSGTYIRSLGFDIGEKLETGAYLTGLVRTEIGDFELDKAVGLDDLDKENWGDFLMANS